jgi:hypothetical protein
MVDTKYHDLTNREKLALVSFARKVDSNVREGLDRVLERDIKSLTELTDAYQEMLDNERDSKRKSAVLDRILSPEQRKARRLSAEESSKKFIR